MNNKLFLKITVLLSGFVVMADLVVIPAVGGIFASFPKANPILYSFFLTGPFLFSLFASILCGILARFISKKHLMIGSYILFIVAACGGALVDNIYYLVTMRLLVGFAYGLALAANMGLIAEVFPDEKERSTMMGLSTAAISVWGILIPLASGYLAVADWHNSYYIYLVSIFILLMIVAFVPKTPPEGKQSSDRTSTTKDGLPFAKFIPVVIAFLLVNIFYNISMYHIAFYLSEAKLGDSSTAGIITSIFILGSFIVSIFFSAIYMRIKRGTPILIFLLMAIGYMVLAYPSNIWTVGIMGLLIGASYGIGISYYYMHASMIVPSSAMSLAMGIIGASMSLGGFLSSYALTAYQTVLGITTITPTFLYIGISLAIGGVLSIILTIQSRREPESTEG